MEEDSEKEYQNILQGQLEAGNVLCPNEFICSKVCIDSKCSAQTAFFCSENDCGKCNLHSICKSMEIARLTQMVKKKTKIARSFMLDILKKQEQLIANIRPKKKNMIDWFLWKDLPGHCQPVVDSLFRKKQTVQIKSQIMVELVNNLKEETVHEPKKEEQLLDTLEREVERMTEKLKAIEEKMLSKFFIKEKESEDTNQKLTENDENKGIQIEKSKIKVTEGKKIPKKEQDPTLSGSKILKGDEQAIEFVLNCLNEPSKTNLLYRATTHGFYARDFHKMCDDKENTLILIYTNHRKTVGGFTPLKWTSEEGTYADPSKRSFLMSIDNKEKMNLMVPERAITIIKNFGPCFGSRGAFDICLHEGYTNGSFTNFPQNYNHPIKKYECGQYAWERFTGLQRIYDDYYKGNENCFRAQEIEMYQIFW